MIIFVSPNIFVSLCGVRQC
jgi:hypothetical protein